MKEDGEDLTKMNPFLTDKFFLFLKKRMLCSENGTMSRNTMSMSIDILSFYMHYLRSS